MIALLNNFRRAKQLALLTVLAATLLVGRASLLAAPPAKPLVELESHIEWSAVTGAWKDLRDGWVTKTTACDDAACVGAQLLRLEQNIEWKAVNPKWQTRRPSWVEECKTATTDAQAAKLLLELEQTIGWHAVDKDWKGLRDGWIARVKGS
ncbi:MAG TPA: hypothetical protein VK474_01610 [Chthoniobacterales bacterium]|nr:hypothetical protein [Chthoniobacterales bacterium]